MSGKITKVYGVGVNDADYTVQPTINGRQVMCTFYRTWKSMIMRCYDKKTHAASPTYLGCSVSSDWLVFSNFKKWMQAQDFNGRQIDKDLLFVGNKIYSAETCVFVDAITNSFITDHGAFRGKCPIGVHSIIGQCIFRAQCRNPFNKKKESLGCFSCEKEAHKAWKKRKHELAMQLADLQSDPRVAAALRTRYL